MCLQRSSEGALLRSQTVCCCQIRTFACRGVLDEHQIAIRQLLIRDLVDQSGSRVLCEASAMERLTTATTQSSIACNFVLNGTRLQINQITAHPADTTYAGDTGP